MDQVGLERISSGVGEETAVVVLVLVLRHAPRSWMGCRRMFWRRARRQQVQRDIMSRIGFLGFRYASDVVKEIECRYCTI